MPGNKQQELREAKLAISRRYVASAIDNIDPERQDLIDRRPPPLLDPNGSSPPHEDFYQRRNDSVGGSLIKQPARRRIKSEPALASMALVGVN